MAPGAEQTYKLLKVQSHKDCDRTKMTWLNSNIILNFKHEKTKK